MNDKVLVFGGTTEGRKLADALTAAGIPHLVSVATDYGKEIEDSFGEKNVIVGRKNADEMAELMVSGGFTVCVDATHPFATLVSAEIKRACEKAEVQYLRLLRDTGTKIGIEMTSGEGGSDRSNSGTNSSDTSLGDIRILTCDSIESAAKELEKLRGKILLLTGSKDLKTIMAEISDKSRVYARVLPNTESIAKCEEAGLLGKQIIAMQGPFSKNMNVALIKEVGASVILTKESGSTGGLDEKLLAARECGIKAVMIKSPESRTDGSESGDSAFSKGYSLSEVLEKLGACENGIDLAKHITLAGIGPGDSRFYTRELEDALKKADVIFGAGSILERLDESGVKADFVPIYAGKDILEFLEGRGSGEKKCISSADLDFRDNGALSGRRAEYANPLALYSGDISLCSGAKSAAKVFERAGYDVHKISGISSIALFAGKLGLGLEDCDIVSAHGRECNVAGYIAEAKKLIILPSSCAHAGEIVKKAFAVAGIGDFDASDGEKERDPDGGENLRIVVGYELGTASEKVFEIRIGCDSSIFSPDEKGKCLLYIENKRAGELPVARGISDDEFIRGKTPMTKEEIRAISIRKLGLSADSLLYDIGAGTGSVSIEAALLHPDIKVVSIEKNDEAVELIKKNKEKFRAENVVVIKGEASEVLKKMDVHENAEDAGALSVTNEKCAAGSEKKLPAPTHAFIGGSGGKMRDVIELLKRKNPNIRIVINCVTLETLTEVLSVIGEGGFAEPDIVQVSASRYRKVGGYHMADAINPVYIVTLSGYAT